jgi:hypothetical protein
LTAIVNIIVNVIARSPVDVIVWTAFGAAMCLLLLGKPNRIRIELGISLFAVGSIGIMIFYVLGSRYFPGQVHWLMPASANKPFSESFENIHGWAETDNERIAASWENGTYYLTVKKPGIVYFSFPPVSYFPEKGEVEALVFNSGVNAMNGYFGMVCHYQKDTHKYYLAYVDADQNRYLVEQVIGEDEVLLSKPGWQPAHGLKDANQVNRVGLTCQDNQITLTLNETVQPTIQVPGMAKFGAGKMGLMTGTYNDAPPQDFKVVFDNAKFWPPE